MFQNPPSTKLASLQLVISSRFMNQMQFIEFAFYTIAYYLEGSGFLQVLFSCCWSKWRIWLTCEIIFIWIKVLLRHASWWTSCFLWRCPWARPLPDPLNNANEMAGMKLSSFPREQFIFLYQLSFQCHRIWIYCQFFCYPWLLLLFRKYQRVICTQVMFAWNRRKWREGVKTTESS